MSELEITKDFTITAATEPGYQGKPRSKGWTVAEVEDAMWQARASGADDLSPVELRYETITVKGVPAWVIEIPPAMRRPATRVEPIPEPSWWQKVPAWEWPFVVAATAFGLPLLIAALVTVVRYALGVIA